MILWALLLWSASCILAKENLRVVQPPLRIDMDPPEETRDTARFSPRTVTELYVSMPIDHFNPQNNDSFQMRYMVNGDHFGGEGSPVFILVGGEWDIVPGWLQAGNMFQMAVENQGYMVYTEHRYYGRSLPFANFTAENLRFLNADQALADLAYFIEDVIKSQSRFHDSQIILYGGSYAANMVLWFKQRYPQLALGVVASSGPILAKVDFQEYLEVVHEAYLLEGGEECIATIRQGIEDTVAAMQTQQGRRLLEINYQLCSPLNYDDIYEMGYFAGLISWTFSGTVQAAVPGNLQTICGLFNGDTFGTTPMAKVGGFVSWYRGLGSNCWTISYDLLKETYSQSNNNRAWYYQTCTEYGFYQTAPTSGTVFDPLKWLSVDFYVDICKENFDPKFDEQFVYDAAERVNLMFGGLEPNVENTINIHGYIDPWRAIGVYEENLKESSPTITVSRASHCFDMQSWLTTDTIEMTNTKINARRIVASWLQ